MQYKYDPTKLFLKTYNYDVWFENEQLTDRKKPTDKK